jgi:hypothetical protein
MIALMIVHNAQALRWQAFKITNHRGFRNAR